MNRMILKSFNLMQQNLRLTYLMIGSIILVKDYIIVVFP